MRALWVLCLLVTRIASADGSECALVRERTPLLDSHLTIRLPIGMVVQPAQADQTRADLEIDGGRFVMTAYETYQSPGTDLEAGTTKEIRRQGGALTLACEATTRGELDAVRAVVEAMTLDL